MMDPKQLDTIFDYHPPANEETIHAHEEVRETCRALAHHFDEVLPPSREKSLALTKVQEAMWAANAAIAIHGLEVGG